MTLQDLVPPLELCKLIPKGEFENTAFCWIDRGHACILPTGRKYPEVMPFIELRRYTMQGDEIPAPTLQEIMEKIDEMTCTVTTVLKLPYSWKTDTIDKEDNLIVRRDAKSPVSAALRVCLELMGVGKGGMP